MTPLPGRREPATVAAVACCHTLSGEVGGIAGGIAGAVGARAPAHYVPPEFDRGALPAEVGESYGGPVFIGEDLMWFELGRRGVGPGGSRDEPRNGCPAGSP